MTASFAELVATATNGAQPFRYQEQIAERGLPEVLEAPTGSGKTLAVVLPWLWRRRYHPEQHVREATPRRLVVALPMRTLVEQTAVAVRGWLERLGLAEVVGSAMLMGGETPNEDWRRRPTADAVIVGTVDMLVSRALNRGFGESRALWPVSYGLLNNDCHWVLDEVQLLGAAVPTSRQLQSLRERWGTVGLASSTWMSATIDREALRTVDRSSVPEPHTIAAEDRQGALATRLAAARRVERVSETETAKTPAAYAGALADAVIARHERGTRTLAVVNTVATAQDLHARIKRKLPAEAAAPVLLHSRFRPADRDAALRAALAEVDPSGPGTIVVATQVIEAGVDLTSRVLVTEACPWPSLVQRAGRCNRYGEHGADGDAVLAWIQPRRPEPYEHDDVAATVQALDNLEGRAVTGEALAATEVAITSQSHPVLRERDARALFDTSPDLSGADLDVSRYVRKTEDIDVAIAWRELNGSAPQRDAAVPARDERCPVPVGQARDFAEKRTQQLWHYDHLQDRWVRVRPRDLRPGMVVLVDAAAGGYDPTIGWAPTSTQRVPDLDAPATDSLDEERDQALAGDPLAFSGTWVPLSVHLRDVEANTRALLDELQAAPVDLPEAATTATVRAGLLHDLGKAHEVFQATLTSRDEGEEAVRARELGPWAKAPGPSRRHERPHFRHELASALALFDHAQEAIEDLDEPDLCRYLVGAHHGRVRLAIRGVPGEVAANGTRPLLGILDGDLLPDVSLGQGQRVPASTLDLGLAEVGTHPERGASWGARMLALRDRHDLGPFRLALLEALVRVADWQASAQPSQQFTRVDDLAGTEAPS